MSPMQTVSAVAAEVTRVVVARNEAELTAVREDWLRLRAGASRVSADADPDFLIGTLPGIAGAVGPYVAVFYRGGTPSGLMVGRALRRRLERRLGYARVRLPAVRSLQVVYGGLVTDGAPQTNEALVGHLRGMLEAGEVDHVSVDFLGLEHPLYATLAKMAQRVEPPVTHWRLGLRSEDPEGTLGHLSRKHRYTLRRNDRLLNEALGGDMRLRVFTRPEEMEEFIAGTAALVSRTYQGGLGVGFADNVVWRSVLDTEARLGRLRGYWLAGGGRPIAFEVGSIHGGAFLLAATSFLPEYAKYSPGTVLLVRVIGALCAEGVRAIDYGFGDAPYKRAYGDMSWSEATLEFYARTPRALMPRGFDASVGRCAAWGARAAAATGVGPWVKRLWRARAAAKADGAEAI